MSRRAAEAGLFVALVLSGPVAGLQAQPVVTHPFPGLTHITRTETMPPVRCPGCPEPPATRLARINVVLVDLTAPEIHVRLTPAGSDLPAPDVPTPGWPLPPPPFETVRQATLGFLEDTHAQVAINGHFFAPLPPPPGSKHGAYAYLIGLAASRGDVYSAFEAPFQDYAIVTDAPALNVDAANRAGIVHRDPNIADGMHVIEGVQLWNALSGSAQIVTNGVTTIPDYTDATHPDGLLAPNGTYARGERSWYDRSNARTAIGLTQDNRTLVLFTVDGTNGGHGMLVSEVADMLRSDYNVWNALNLDGGGSTTLAMQDPVTHQRRIVNVPSDHPPRTVGSNFGVYSDGVFPVTTVAMDPAPNGHGWNRTPVTVTLVAADLASGVRDTPEGWVDHVQYRLTGAQAVDATVVSGARTSFLVSAPGTTTAAFFATDAAGNVEGARSAVVRVDGVAPVIAGLPAPGCWLRTVNHRLRSVAVVTAADAESGIASFAVTATSSELQDPARPDVVVTPDGSGGFVVELRAERMEAGPGRVYTVRATASDHAGNVQAASATCVVPHVRGTRNR